MNLIIDIGNTKIKAAIFRKGVQINSYTSENKELPFIQEILDRYPKIVSAIISSVRSSNNDLFTYLKSKLENVCFFDNNITIPLENLYETKNTLGYDRLAACVGAYFKYPNKNILVIDAGTAITFDFVNENAQYIGGCISPGLHMRYKALHEFTKKLPLLESNEEQYLIGKNTNQAITGGVQNGILFEIDAYVNKLRKEYKNLIVVITGGDAAFLHKKIENKTNLDLNILTYGLNEILEYNLASNDN